MAETAGVSRGSIGRKAIQPSAEQPVERLGIRLRDHGSLIDRKWLFVIDGSKALPAAIAEGLGAEQSVRRCRDR